MKVQDVKYTAKAYATGGRDGRAWSESKVLDVSLSIPKQLGGADLPGTNPEELFAAGYSACFLGAMTFVAGQLKKKLPAGTKVNGLVGIGPIPTGFGIEAELIVSLPGMDYEEAVELVEKAHIVCPYSNATRDNINVKTSIEV
ncbi:organic hydroperoxide resistance protein [Kluyvera sichuanensis]|uniref:Organic hydroperoxide resistance protein n=1 Tax=Kluyvera sichuanensis TaxID=2725494 RepID=A0ABR6RN28_9ENTR|nr:organic hydroperoxide resistance protein [Kluyvera sichuanensis]MBC1184526.1 organic hydroperoxide resistance protein [Kluyvera sichuanensis]